MTNTRSIYPSSLSKHANRFNMDRTIEIPNWEDVTKILQYPGGQISDFTERKTDPLARFNAENFGHQNTKHIGGVPGRIGGCTATDRYAMQGKISGQLLTLTKALQGWQPLVYNKKTYDSYQYITFKLKQGAIECILP